MKYFIALLMLFTASVQAAVVDLSWTAATQRTDGALFDMATEGLGYHIWVNGVQEVDTNGDPILLGVGLNTLNRTVSSGNYCFILTTVPKKGDESDPSEEVCKDVYAKAGAPSNLIINIR